MKKSTKIVLKITMVLGILGIVLMLLGVGMGASWEDAGSAVKTSIKAGEVQILEEIEEEEILEELDLPEILEELEDCKDC